MRGLQPGSIFNSRYEIKRQIGSGGMGVIFEAVDLSRGGLRCALKLLRDHREVDRRYQRRFAEELKLLTRLNHPHIVEVFDASSVEIGEESGGDTSPSERLYIVMELLHGESLGERLKSDRPLKLNKAIQLINQALSALESAHREGVVHRDLKPDNLFITLDDRGHESLKVLDFGVAKDLTSDLSLTASIDNAMIGTPHYMSPEQVKNEQVGAWSDLYSIGVILYQMIRGRPVFSEPKLEVPDEIKAFPKSFQLTWLQINSEAPPLQFESELDQIVKRLLSKEPTSRYYDARNLRYALRDWLTRHPDLGDTFVATPRSADQDSPLPPSSSLGLSPDHETPRSLTSITPQIDGVIKPHIISMSTPDELFSTLPPQTSPLQSTSQVNTTDDHTRIDPSSERAQSSQLDGSSSQRESSVTESLTSGVRAESVVTRKRAAGHETSHHSTHKASPTSRLTQPLTYVGAAVIALAALSFLALTRDQDAQPIQSLDDSSTSSERPQPSLVSQDESQTFIALKRSLERAAKAQLLHQAEVDVSLTPQQSTDLDQLLQDRTLEVKTLEGDAERLSTDQDAIRQAQLRHAFMLTWLEGSDAARRALLTLHDVKLTQLKLATSYHIYGLTLLRCALTKSRKRRQTLALKAFKLADRKLTRRVQLTESALAELDVRLTYYLELRQEKYASELLIRLQERGPLTGTQRSVLFRLLAGESR